MNLLSVSRVCKLTGLTEKALRHYDKIGLLCPARKPENGYRYYGKRELIKLQRILFLKELEFGLEEIKNILNNPCFDVSESLILQKKYLTEKVMQYKKAIIRIDKLIDDIKNEKENEIMLTNDELFEGFNKEDARKYREEASARWGEESVRESENRIKILGKDGWKLVKDTGEAIAQVFADLSDKHHGHPDVQDNVEKFREYLTNFYEVPNERLLGLGRLYVEDERFRSHYEKYKPGLAEFINEAIVFYVNEGKGKKNK